MTCSIEFKLFAPNNQAAELKGSFCDWKAIPMKKGEDGYFRTEVELEDGIYRYKFRVQSKSASFQPDEWVDVNDPYATDIDSASQNSVVRIKDGQKIIDTYIWQHDDKLLPSNEQLVIYEMHVGDFSGGEDDPFKRGKFKHVIEKLDYLSELGVNAIELMPVNEFPGNYSWGYLVRYFFAVESSYGSSEDFKRLVDECHGRRIRVILDGIYNHSDDQSPLLKIDRDYWYYHDKHYPDDPANHWGPEFNYDTYDEKLNIKPAWQFIGDVVRFWIQEYHIDGIRYDAVRQIGNNDFLHWITQEATQAAGDKPFYNIAEHIPESPQLVAADGPMEGCWHESFRIFTITNITGDTFDLSRLKEVLDGKSQGYWRTTSAINYLASHDRDHLMAEESFRTLNKESAFKRAKLGAVLLMTAMGVPMLWMGEEFGEYTHQTPNQSNKLQWPMLKHELNHSLFEYYKILIQLRTSNPALFTENIEFFHENAESKVIAYVRWNDEGYRLVVVANFSDESLAGYLIPNFPAAGIWRDLIDNCEIKAGEGTMMLDLPETTAKVLIWQPAV